MKALLCTTTLLFAGNTVNIAANVLFMFLWILMIVWGFIFIHNLTTKPETCHIKHKQRVYFITLVATTASLSLFFIPLMLLYMNAFIHSVYPLTDINYKTNPSCVNVNNNDFYQLYTILFAMFCINIFCGYGSICAAYLQRLILIFKGSFIRISNKVQISFIIFIILLFLDTSLLILATIIHEELLKSICGMILMMLFLIESGYICYVLINKLTNFIKLMRDQILEQYKSDLANRQLRSRTISVSSKYSTTINNNNNNSNNNIQIPNNCTRTELKSIPTESTEDSVRTDTTNNVNYNVNSIRIENRKDSTDQDINDDSYNTYTDYNQNNSIAISKDLDISIVSARYKENIAKKISNKIMPLFTQTRKLTILTCATFISTIIDIVTIGVLRIAIHDKKPMISIAMVLSMCAICIDLVLNFACLTLQFTFSQTVYDKTFKIFEKLPLFKKLETSLKANVFINLNNNCDPNS